MQNLVFFDTETTSKDNPRCIQLAFQEAEIGSIDNPESEVVTCNGITTSIYFKNPVPIEIEAMSVHHITEKMLAEAKPFEELKTQVQDIFNDGVIAIAHNAKFDIGVLATEGVTIKNVICTYKVAMRLYDLPQYKLQYLRYLWDIDMDATAHDAKGDVDVLATVFWKILGDYQEKNNCTTREAIKEFIKITSEPMILRRFAFGKYAGKTFDEVYNTDKGYFEWLSGQRDVEEDLRYTLKYYLGGKQTTLC